MGNTDKYLMTPDTALRWLIEYGSGYVKTTDILRTWADDELNWFENEQLGFLEYDCNSRDYVGAYRLTQKSIDLIQENKDGQNDDT